MPETATGVREALTSPTRPGRQATALRVAVGAIFTLSALAVPHVAGPQPVAAGSSCTGWTSKAKPPRTIRVLRTRSGKVEQVKFRRYVAEVMASGEWPDHLKMATLEAGALATKQYAWYYALKGNHRSWYVSRGKCYDVRDDTADQLYRPERAKPTARQWKAIDRTWDLTLRKRGRFFLTGYRAGTNGRCAADANGWKLYARSVNACAKQGWSSTRILNRYLNPNLAMVWSDQAGPIVRQPSLSLRVGNVMPGATRLSWKPKARSKDVTRYVIQRKVGTNRWWTVATRKGTSVDVRMKQGKKNRFRVRAVDAKGRRGPWSYSVRRTAAVRGPVGRILSGNASLADERKPRIRIRFRGRAAGFITDTGPNMGKVKILVDGRTVAVVDLERAQSSQRKLVWTTSWKKARKRTIVVKSITPDARVDFEGLYTLR